jgi:hypothetical protein
LAKPTLDRVGFFLYNIYLDTQKELKMSRVATRVIEIDPGEWVCQFESPRGWTTFSDTFVTEAEALSFEAEQIASADWGDEE